MRLKSILSALCFVYFLSVYSQSNTDFKTKSMQQSLIQPAYLVKGDTVAIVATSGILKQRDEEILRATNLLKNWGLNVVVGKHVFAQARHFAGADEERCEDFQKALDDPKIKAIWCARGGYGAVRILDKLDYTAFKKHPKWVIGFSDVTALHNQIHTIGVQSLHAMMGVSLTKNLDDIKHTIQTFKSALFGAPLSYTIKGSPYNKIGVAKGVLVGGNLTILHTMLGSSTSIDTSGKILFIEEIGEYKYHVDRMLQSLKRAGYFKNCKAVIVGDMTKMKKNTTPWGSSIEQLILDALAEYNFPVAFNFPAGHEKDNRALILGRMVELDVKATTTSLVFKE